MRLLALQSASRRWQQKEQQVMKESKEKLNRAKTTPDHYRVTTRSAFAGRGRPGPGAKGQEKGKTASRPGTERTKVTPKGHPAKHTLSPGTAVSLVVIITLININLLNVKLQANSFVLLFALLSL